ncbi:MAG: substrate-binding domain-containing protein [Treponema sp.]|nr:substrate-binding domain-containing protein [Treponema sp.]
MGKIDKEKILKTFNIIKIVFCTIIGIGMIWAFYDPLVRNIWYRRAIDIYDVLFGIMCAAIIAFIILCNITKLKRIYFLFLVPVVCILTGLGISRYEYHISSIPTLYEELDLYYYMPFSIFEANYPSKLAVLGEDSNFKIIDNLPKLDGATAFYPVYAAFVQAVYPVGKYSYWDKNSPVICTRTASAYDNLLNGEVDIIFCLEPSNEQLQRFINRGLNIKFVPIGKEAFVFFVNANNRVNNISIQDIHGIYSGNITNWRHFDGPNKNILVFQRPKNSGSQTILEKIMGDVPIVDPKIEDVKQGMGYMVSQVAAYKNFNNSIGYSFLQYSTEMLKNDQIKLLSIDDISPSAVTIQDDSYPFTVFFYAVYIEKEGMNPNINPFIQWILSEQGQTLVSGTGYVPVN